uniref:Uncharacterized protein n=1 Tax=Peronospora matthiolae TaxID=2874970 RepID=A0AAV1TXY5_9STRA
MAVDGDRHHAVVAFNQSTFPRLYDDTADGPGLFKPYDKAVNTTLSVGPRLLGDSAAVQGTGVVDQQTEERVVFSDVLKKVLNALQLRRPRGIDANFDKMFTQAVRALRDQGVDYSDEALYTQIMQSVPRHELAVLLSSIGNGVVEKGHVTELQQKFAQSIPLSSNDLVDVWKELNLKPRTVLETVRDRLFCRVKTPADAVTLEEMDKHMFLETAPDKTTDLERSRAFYNFLKMLKELHKDVPEDLEKLARQLKERYDMILHTRLNSSPYLASS